MTSASRACAVAVVFSSAWKSGVAGARAAAMSDWAVLAAVVRVEREASREWRAVLEAERFVWARWPSRRWSRIWLAWWAFRRDRAASRRVRKEGRFWDREDSVGNWAFM